MAKNYSLEINSTFLERFNLPKDADEELQDFLDSNVYPVEAFSNLEKKPLSIVEMDSLNLSVIGEDLGKLKYVEKLILRNLSIKELPKSIGQLQNLKTLEVINCPLKELPTELSNCINLECIRLEFVAIEHVENIFFSSLKKLSIFQLNTAPLKCFPINIFQAPKLKDLTLVDTDLQGSIPEIPWHSSLDTFVLRNSKVTSIPKTLGQLELSELCLQNNEITSLPDDFFVNYPAYLYLSHNPLQSIPESFWKWFGKRSLQNRMVYGGELHLGHCLLTGVDLENIYQMRAKTFYKSANRSTQNGLIAIYANHQKKMAKLPISVLYLALQSRNNRLIGHSLQFLCQYTFKAPIRKNSRILALNLSAKEIKVLNDQLLRFDIKIEHQYHPKIDYILLGFKGNNKLDKLPQDIHWEWITEQTIQHYLAEVAGEETHKYLANIEQLIFSLEDQNISLALELIKGIQDKRVLKTALFIIAKFSKNAEEQKEASKLLYPIASPPLKAILKKRFSLDLNPFEKRLTLCQAAKFQGYFRTSYLHTELEFWKIATVYSLRYIDSFFLGIVLSNATEELQAKAIVNNVPDYGRLEISAASFPKIILNFDNYTELRIFVRTPLVINPLKPFVIPAGIAQLENLEKIWISSFPLEEQHIPVAALQKLPKLKSLWLCVSKKVDQLALKAAFPNVGVTLNTHIHQQSDD
ncbi:MAG: hypothetical protein MK212_08740 [Saprospiraceae bacterium]|nr:hypothetical protein [Saprospiraceae bacterium]